MGAKLLEIYDFVTQKAGMEGRMRLAEKTGISKAKASEIEDTDELIEMLKRAVTEILSRK